MGTNISSYIPNYAQYGQPLLEDLVGIIRGMLTRNAPHYMTNSPIFPHGQVASQFPQQPGITNPTAGAGGRPTIIGPNAGGGGANLPPNANAIAAQNIQSGGPPGGGAFYKGAPGTNPMLNQPITIPRGQPEGAQGGTPFKGLGGQDLSAVLKNIPNLPNIDWSVKFAPNKTGNYQPVISFNKAKSPTGS